LPGESAGYTPIVLPAGNLWVIVVVPDGGIQAIPEAIQVCSWVEVVVLELEGVIQKEVLHSDTTHIVLEEI
jgi:hypothetical protein